MPSAAENCTLFEKQLVHYWVLVNVVEELDVGHDVTMWPEMPIMSWVLTDAQSIRLTRPSKIARWNCYL